jgi:hypothetical protein
MLTTPHVIFTVTFDSLDGHHYLAHSMRRKQCYIVLNTSKAVYVLPSAGVICLDDTFTVEEVVEYRIGGLSTFPRCWSYLDHFVLVGSGGRSRAVLTIVVVVTGGGSHGRHEDVLDDPMTPI